MACSVVAVAVNRQLTHTSLIKPGAPPTLIGTFTFNTLNTMSFNVGHLIPTTAKQFDVTVVINSGGAKETSTFCVWLWTELGNDQQDVKFKQGLCYPQNAYSSDSETFSFTYSSDHPQIFLKSNYANGQNMSVYLYAVGYAQ